MCFSATASFAVGGTLSLVGTATLKKIQSVREVPFAAIPLLLGIQQIIEGIVWISFGAPIWNAIAVYAYALFSQALWPIFVPWSILLLEKDLHRKSILRILALVGTGVGLYLLYFITTEPVTAHIVDHSIAYSHPHFYPLLLTALYLFAICGSCFASSHRIINVFGVTLFASFMIAVWLYYTTFFSVWCFFAAVLSLIVYWFFRKRR